MGLKMDQVGKELRKNNSTTKILDPWDPDTLFRGVQAVIIILMSGDFRATPFARLISSIFWKGFSKGSRPFEPSWILWASEHVRQDS